MEATGLEKGGIDRHFDSKQQLAAEAFDYAWKLVLDTRFKGKQAISNTVDRLKQIVRNFWERRAGLVPGDAHCSTRQSIPTTEIRSFETRPGALLALGWIACEPSSKRGKDEARSAAISIRQNWQY
jgi:AcrR family transcriptional regulator